jgi:zona occludens toxin (predicted ATPase)
MQDVLPTWIHRGNMFVIGETWRLFKEAHLEQDFSIFWLEVSL